MKATLVPARVEFDHLVVMLRDEVEARSVGFEAAGYCLGAPGYHNLGSMNRLIVLSTSYIELLGWPAGTQPKRPEIAAQPMGLDALVFRSEDAQADYARLVAAGFDVQPVSQLERPVAGEGGAQMARFNTVRFNTQPIAGLRVYFCQHLTPEHIWNEALLEHQNGARFLHSIRILAADAQTTAQTLGKLVDGEFLAEEDHYTLKLPNMELIVQSEPGTATARIDRVMLQHADGNLHVFDDGIATT